MVGWRGQQLALVYGFTPGRATDFIDRFLPWQNPKVPGSAHPGHKVKLFYHSANGRRRICVRVEGAINP
jgi:hypothetical protein